MKILHVFDHTLPLHSGYTFRSAAILRNQRKMGWDTYHLSGPKQINCDVVEEDADGLHFYRTPQPTGLFNQDFLREVVETHQSGRRDYSVILWTVLMFDAFLGQVLGMDETERQAA